MDFVVCALFPSFGEKENAGGIERMHQGAAEHINYCRFQYWSQNTPALAVPAKLQGKIDQIKE